MIALSWSIRVGLDPSLSVSSSSSPEILRLQGKLIWLLSLVHHVQKLRGRSFGGLFLLLAQVIWLGFEFKHRFKLGQVLFVDFELTGHEVLVNLLENAEEEVGVFEDVVAQSESFLAINADHAQV